jgi:spore coat polysaccharide biosynthesis protein SpsF
MDKFMKINISIEARMSSTRLPKKVMLPINGKINLALMIDRIKKSKLVDEIIVATTTNKEDDEIVNWCIANHISYFRGSENNVYDRVLKTHIKYNSDIIVELTGDCPLLDPQIIDKALDIYLNKNYDYVSTGWDYPLGMAVQVYSLDTLKSISQNRELQYQDMEHVTPYLYTSDKYKVYAMIPNENQKLKDLSVTLDTQEDFEVIQNVTQHFDNFDFSLEEIVLFAKQNPKQVSLNHNTHRKGLS